jgi:hypothetical protein
MLALSCYAASPCSKALMASRRRSSPRSPPATKPAPRFATPSEGDADSLKVIGLAAAVQVLHSEFVNDRLDINTLAGDDRVDPDGLQIGVIKLFVDGVLVP